MSSDQDIIITINNKTHHFKSNDIEAMLKLPWSERKQLIGLLENIKQAEYLDKPTDVNQTKSETETQKQSSAVSTPDIFVQPKAHEKAKLDPAIKMGEGDVDSLMNRLILEDKKHHTQLPDKGIAIKWMLIVFGVIILLAIIF